MKTENIKATKWTLQCYSMGETLHEYKSTQKPNIVQKHFLNKDQIACNSSVPDDNYNAINNP